MKQSKFDTGVVDWKTFENNFNQQDSNDSIMIFKSKKRNKEVVILPAPPLGLRDIFY